jgi:Ca-activated chloride channel family protein
VRLALLLFAILWPVQGIAQCRVALVLALDVSQSVDGREYRLQMDGITSALTDPEVMDLLTLPGAPAAISVFEWSGPQERFRILDWTLLTDRAALDRVVTHLNSHERGFSFGPTALGSALEAAHAQASLAPPCGRVVVDISGDGLPNAGPSVADVNARLNWGDTIINGLIVGGDTSPEITAFYISEVIRGPGAFTEVATDYTDYARAMRRKLLRELAIQVVQR